MKSDKNNLNIDRLEGIIDTKFKPIIQTGFRPEDHIQIYRTKDGGSISVDSLGNIKGKNIKTGGPSSISVTYDKKGRETGRKYNY